MTTTGSGPHANAAVAVACGAAVLLVVVLAVLLSPPDPSDATGAVGAPSSAATADPWPPDASPVPSAAPSTAAPSTDGPQPTPTDPASPAPAAAPAPAPVPTPAPDVPADGGTGTATPAPAWLGTRALAAAGSGPVRPQDTPPELLDRRIVTPDLLPPPRGGGFAPVTSGVPDGVLARSTWQPACPVAVEDLRYLTVQHWGFDDRLHTGEVLVHADAVDAVVAAFAAMYEERFPLEEVRVIRADELDAAPTGDGNVTSAFVCRPSVGSNRWSRHAYGLALDVNPFHNPYDRGRGAERLVLPELATAYTDRQRALPGMLSARSAAVRAAEDAGWGWGGRWDRAHDWMHISDDGT